MFPQGLLTDMRTRGIRPNGWKMTRNNNLHSSSTDSNWGKESQNSRKLTALELKMLPAVNVAQFITVHAHFIHR